MPSKISLSAITLILCLVIGTAYGEAAGGGDDTVVFKNGDRISGRLTRATIVSVQLDSRALGSLTIPWSDIVEVESHSRQWRLDLTGKICTRWNERESTWRKSGSCQLRGTSQSRS